MASDRACCHRRAPRWLPLLLDVALVTLSLLLDVRDLWFKLRWIGPRDDFAFSTVETRHLAAPDAAPLQPTTTYAYEDQKAQRSSGWSSFLQKCESLTPLTEQGETRGFHYAVGTNCLVGASSSSVRATELFLTSSIRVDSMAWTACELLYKHRKPPICHSPIVTQFRERCNLQNEVVYMVAEPPSTVESPKTVGFQESYAVKPGSEAENELIELLEVISKSSPVSAAVCVEGFVLKGSGRYIATTYGCGSPSFYRSVFVGGATPSFVQCQRDKAWLTSDTLGVIGMRFIIRENRRSIFTVRDPAADSGGKRVLEHTSLLNFSASGSLYTLMILIDLILLMLNICGVVEAARFILWPLWRPLIASEYQTSSARTTKMGFGVEDYTCVLQVGLLRSTPVALLTVISRLLTWMIVIPSTILWSDGNLDSGDTHAFLTMIRCCDLTVVCVNFIWNMVVAYNEKLALMFVRETYISPLEITSIGVAITIVVISLVVPSYGARRDEQRIFDHTSFENATALANPFFTRQRSSNFTALLEIYYPLLIIVGINMFVGGVLVISRRVEKSMIARSLVQSNSAPVSAVQPNTTSKKPTISSFRKDLTSCSAGILMHSVSPPPSPTREELGGSVPRPTSVPLLYSSGISDDRLPIEKMVDIPLRALSLVRNSWDLEKMADSQLLLLPVFYIKYGVVLVGRFMKTRCGFTNIVQPLVHTQEHEKLNELEPEYMTESSSKPNLR